MITTSDLVISIFLLVDLKLAVCIQNIIMKEMLYASFNKKMFDQKIKVLTISTIKTGKPRMSLFHSSNFLYM